VNREAGFALLAVMLVLTLLSVVVTEFVVSMRLEATTSRAFKDGLVAEHLAEAAVEQATREVLSQAPIQALDDAGVLVFYRGAPGSQLPTRLPSLPRQRVDLGLGQYSYRITDEEARLNLNTATPDRLDRLLRTLGLDKEARDTVTDSFQDWTDPDDLPRLNGAESDDYYLKLPLPYRARNAPLQDPAELLQIRGVTPALYWGTDDRPGLVDLVTVFGRDTVSLNTASASVLAALGLSDAEIADILQTRTRTPYTAVPGRFAGHGLSVGSATFRVEAEGWIGGSRKARVVAVIQRRAPPPAAVGAARLGIVALSWRPGAGR
jgi:type II secretory pathway component PulK